MKKFNEKRNDCRPALYGKNDKARNRGTDGTRKNTEPKLPLFRQFMAVLLGGVIGSLIGTILFKILINLL